MATLTMSDASQKLAVGPRIRVKCARKSGSGKSFTSGTCGAAFGACAACSIQSSKTGGLCRSVEDRPDQEIGVSSLLGAPPT